LRLGIEVPTSTRLRELWQRAARELGVGVLKCLITRGDAVLRGYAPAPGAAGRIVLLGYREPIEPPREPLVLWACAEPVGGSPRLAGIKTLNRLDQVLASRDWRAAAAARQLPLSEGLLVDTAGHLVGGCSSNLFWRRGNTWWTPRITGAAIDGIMRGVVRRIAATLGWSLRETDAPLEELLAADEVFMTNVRWQCRTVARLWYRDGAALRDWPIDTPALQQLRTCIEQREA
jgi:4-amino-4-deoxychorismate lyase